MQRDTPEDKLLRLIKGEHNKAEKKVPQEVAPAAPAKNSFWNETAKKTLLDNYLFKPIVLKLANKALIATLVVLTLYFVYGVFFGARKDVDSILAGNKAAAGSGDEDAGKIIVSPEAKDYFSYSKGIEGKELFTQPSPAAGAGGGVAAQAIDVTKRFNLVGILSGAEPQAIIEDKEAQKTYYLKRGESFLGITVDEIASGRVVLNYEGNQVELLL